jgi:dihydropteroate synthase
MSLYYRPLAQFDPVRPSAAVPIADGWCWFDRVALCERGRAPQTIPAHEVPVSVLDAITRARPDVAAMSLSSPRLMGILNVTPDSFSDGGAFVDPAVALRHGQGLIGAGADILDIGGESTRPGAAQVSVDDEIARTAPVLGALRRASAIPLSIDTRKAPVARAALQAGATMVNDVSALGFDPHLAAVVAETGVPICLMHAQGSPETMQDDPEYDDVLLDVFDALDARIQAAVAAGIGRDRIVVDPGIGFGKTLEHNLALLRGLALFHGLGCAVLLGASRKRFIGTLANAPQTAQRMPGSLGVALAAVAKGVQIVRVHDIEETRQALTLWAAATSARL